MNEAISVSEKKVRAAAVAGWWTVLFLLCFVTFQWIVYLLVMHTRPAWFLWIWGPNIDWPFVQIVWFWVIVTLKFVLWLMVLASLWLTLFANHLRD